MPRRGTIQGLADWFRFGLGVADQAQTSTPAVEDTAKIVVPWDPLRAGQHFVRTVDSSLTVPALRRELVMIIGGRNGTYIVGMANNTASGVLFVSMGFDASRADTVARYTDYTQLVAGEVLTSARPANRLDPPTTVFEVGHIAAADSQDSTNDGVLGAVIFGSLQLYPPLTFGQPLYIAPGSVFWIQHGTDAADLLTGFLFQEP